jgi:hypothetical protein
MSYKNNQENNNPINTTKPVSTIIPDNLLCSESPVKLNYNEILMARNLANDENLMARNLASIEAGYIGRLTPDELEYGNTIRDNYVFDPIYINIFTFFVSDSTRILCFNLFVSTWLTDVVVSLYYALKYFNCKWVGGYLLFDAFLSLAMLLLHTPALALCMSMRPCTYYGTPDTYIIEGRFLSELFYSRFFSSCMISICGAVVYMNPNNIYTCMQNSYPNSIDEYSIFVIMSLVFKTMCYLITVGIVMIPNKTKICVPFDK